MSVTEQEARSTCPLGTDMCEECHRLGDDCDGNEDYWKREEMVIEVNENGRI